MTSPWTRINPIAEQNRPTSGWVDRATAFLVRTRTRIWGKFNEDVVVPLFQSGFQNLTLKDGYFGWHRKPVSRGADHWGLPAEIGPIHLPAGIVVPVLMDQRPARLEIITILNDIPTDVYVVPGSISAAVWTDNGSDTLVVVQDLFSGMWLQQELGEDIDIMVYPVDTATDDPELSAMLATRSSIYTAGCDKETAAAISELTAVSVTPCIPPTGILATPQTSEKNLKLITSHIASP